MIQYSLTSVYRAYSLDALSLLYAAIALKLGVDFVCMEHANWLILFSM
jgi:hypothetical protein